MTYLITCSGSKQTPEIYNPSNIADLSYDSILRHHRLELIELTGIQLDWEKTLPAWQLYSGTRSKLYPQVHNWTQPCISIKILSALFGWVNHTDLLPYYDLKMDSMVNNTTIWKFWSGTELLQQIVDSQEDIDLLSVLYRKAINRNGNPVTKLPDVKFTDRGVQKGRWLNAELNTITCQ